MPPVSLIANSLPRLSPHTGSLFGRHLWQLRHGLHCYCRTKTITVCAYNLLYPYNNLLVMCIHQAPHVCLHLAQVATELVYSSQGLLDISALCFHVVPHLCTPSQGAGSNISIASSVMQDGEMEVRTQGSKDPWFYFSIVMLVCLFIFLGIYTQLKM